MQQRQLRLGDILDDYCPRERRVTNHAVVAMIGPDVKQTRCTTCDTEHEYKHAKVPRQRRKPDTPAALLAQAAGGPKRVPHEPEGPPDSLEAEASAPVEIDHDQEEAASSEPVPLAAQEASPSDLGEVAADESPANDQGAEEEGPVHRPLIRATLPRVDGQPPPPRPAPEFTIRQPGGRQNRFRGRQQQGGQQFFGNRSNGGQGGGGHRQQGGWNSRQQDGAQRHSRRQGQGQGHKRSK